MSVSVNLCTLGYRFLCHPFAALVTQQQQAGTSVGPASGPVNFKHWSRVTKTSRHQHFLSVINLLLLSNPSESTVFPLASLFYSVHPSSYNNSARSPFLKPQLPPLRWPFPCDPRASRPEVGCAESSKSITPYIPLPSPYTPKSYLILLSAYPMLIVTGRQMHSHNGED